MAFGDSRAALASVLTEMTIQEKLDLLNGAGLWKTKANYRLNIPEIVVTDGAHGLRYSITQIENSSDEQANIRDFLAIVSQTAEGRSNTKVGLTRPATCFPNGSLIGCSWDVDLLREIGETLAVECHHFGVNLLLGPGINIRRTPLAGRSYEYYSEDPVVAGDLAAAFISGLQENGVGASLKHFACNNSEIERTTMNSVIDERALREIYLAGFERAIAKSSPWTIMSSYNLVNGEQVSNSKTLLTDILRTEWGYDGVVVSDWHGIKDRPASIAAGNDLDMPQSRQRTAAALSAVQSGALSVEAVDRSAMRVLELIAKAKAGERKVSWDPAAHQEIARRAALESIVLLKNEGQILPLSAAQGAKLLVVGSEAVEPAIQGAGSATTNPTRVDIPFDQIADAAGPKSSVRYLIGPTVSGDSEAIRSVLDAAKGVDVVIVFSGTISGADGEASDRRNLRLAPGQDELIQALADAGSRVVVVLTMPDAVEMPWVDGVDAIVATFFMGQGGGNAVAQILFGQETPSGKLSASFPKTIGDIPGIHTYPGENDRHVYGESIFVGYRSYDLRNIDPLFPFGHGLSYTCFDYSDMTVDADQVCDEQDINVSVTVRNTGSRRGKEIVQFYVSPQNSGARRPIRELKAFAKVALEPNEEKRVTVTLDPRAFMYYQPAAGRWVIDADGFTIEAAASSRDIRSSVTLPYNVPRTHFRRLTSNTQPKYILENPEAVVVVSQLVSERLGVTVDEARALLELTRHWFLSLFQSLSWYVGENFSAADLDAALATLNDSDGAS